MTPVHLSLICKQCNEKAELCIVILTLLRVVLLCDWCAE